MLGITGWLYGSAPKFGTFLYRFFDATTLSVDREEDYDPSGARGTC